MLTYANCLAFAWRPENDGSPWHCTPGDPGAGTAWGVTAATWTAWASENARDCALQDATKAELASLLHRMFWVPAGQGLPSGVNLMVFDFGLTSGPARSVRFLQAAISIQQDGACGPVTEAAAASVDARSLCQLLHGRQAAHYRADPLARRFPGWFRRNDDRLGVALASLTAPATPTV